MRKAESEQNRDHGYSNAMQDEYEGCPLATVGGDESNMKAPKYIVSTFESEYLDGYREACDDMYGNGVYKVKGRKMLRVPRRFHLVRNEDESGVSGEGTVAEGVVFTDGSCVMRWLTHTSSTALYKTLADLETIHGHEGRTTVVFVDENNLNPQRLP